MKKENLKTIDGLTKKIESIEKQLQVECSKCDGTGKPRTKTGKPPQDKSGNAKCATCYGTGLKGSVINIIEDNIISIKKDIKRIGDSLSAYINRQFTEIRVLPEGHNPNLQGGNSKIKSENGWEDYSGDFYINDDEQKEIVLKKALKHFDTYFKDGVYHRNKKLGLFLSSPRSGKRLIKEMETGN